MKYGLWPEIIIFKENPYENALEYLAFGKGFVLDRLTGSTSKLKSLIESLTRIFN